MKQRVVFFTTGMSAGGAERVIATLANALVGRDFDVVIAMAKGTESAYDLSPRVRLRSANLEPGLKNLPRALRFYRHLVRQEVPDVVVSFSTKSDIIALLSRLMFRTPGRLVVSDRADPYSRDRRMQRVCDALYRWSDSLVCQSQSVADYYRPKYRHVEISVIPNPLNEECVGTPAVAPREPTVISVGRLSEQKNHSLAIRAFGVIRERFPELTMKIYGAGPQEVELQELIRTEGLQDVVMLAGVAPNVMRQNERAALFLFTSNFEGYPNALMEAAATGIPTVTTDFSPGTAKEIIDDGTNGYIVPLGDRHAVVAAAIKALSGELKTDAMAVQRVREAHRTDRILESWLRVFRTE